MASAQSAQLEPAVVADRLQERQESEGAREEEEAVHAPVDPVEERHPARGDDRGGDQRGAPIREPRGNECDDRDARHGEHDRQESERGQGG